MKDQSLVIAISAGAGIVGLCLVIAVGVTIQRRYAKSSLMYEKSFASQSAKSNNMMGVNSMYGNSASSGDQKAYNNGINSYGNVHPMMVSSAGAMINPSSMVMSPGGMMGYNSNVAANNAMVSRFWVQTTQVNMENIDLE